MRFLLILIIAFQAFWISGCADKENYFYEGLLIGLPKANRQATFLTESNDLYARQVGPYEVAGYGNGYYFYSSNQFASFSSVEVPIGEEVLAWDAPQLLTRDSLAPNQFVIKKFTNNGYVLASADTFHIAPNVLGAKVSAASPQDYYMITLEIPGVVKCSRIEGGQLRALGSVTAHQLPHVVYFASPSEGWAGVVQAGSIAFHATSDSGKTWIPEPPVSVPTGFVPTRMSRLLSGDICLFGYIGEQPFSIYRKTNQAWQTHPLGTLLDIQFIDNNLGWAIAGVGETNSDGRLVALWQTTSGGATWKRNSDTVLNASRLHFFNAHSGVVYGPNIMHSTLDGGVNWRLMLYPYRDE